MFSKNNIKLINSLQLKKYRKKNNLFVVEGEKLLKEALNSSQLTFHSIYCTENFIIHNKNLLSNKDYQIIEDEELNKVSSLKTPNSGIALLEIPRIIFSLSEIRNQLSIFLDNIQDPGNLGTIIRTCDWFGIKNVFCSRESVDVYNSKVIQSTMGSIFRVNVNYVESTDFLQELTSIDNFKIYGTFPLGDNIYNFNLSKSGLIIIGNESNGISDEVRKFVTHSLTIPNLSENNSCESLNASVATAIVLNEFKRS